MISNDYIEYASALPGVDASLLINALGEKPSVSIKVNKRKWREGADALGYGALEPVKWCESGYYLPERPNFTLNPLLHAGAFYVQDASSMIYETLVSKLAQAGYLPQQAAVLDLCAAPGGKSTSMINSLPDGTLIVANEFKPLRAAALRENLFKWGYPDIIITNSDTGRFAACGEVFDLVAVDAPCSGEGMMRKDPEAAAQWSQGLISQCVRLQKEILANAVCALKPGGVMIYSTCTFNLEENERQLKWLADTYGLEAVPLELPSEWGIGRELEGDITAWRFMPHLTRGEGLFVSVLRKPDERTAAVRSLQQTADTIRKKTKVVADGIPQFNKKGKIELPASESVLTTGPKPDYPHAALTEEEALRYLRHESILLGEGAPKGYVEVTYKGLPLGLVKNIGARANNLYPKEWKIRMQLTGK